MDDQHIIEHAVFDVSFGSEYDAFEEQANLGVLVKNRLMRVVDQVFDEMSGGERVFRINTLEVDLGDVAYVGYPEELESRLEDRLRAALREKLASISTQPGSPEAALTRQQSELDQLEYFLLNGRLPWQADLGAGRTVDQLLLRVVRSNARKLADFLRNSPSRSTVVSRLISQFHDENLAEIAGIFYPDNARFPADLVSDFRKLWRKYKFAAATEREFRTFIWRQVITELLESGRSSLDPGPLVERIMKRITLTMGGDGSGLLTALANEAALLEFREGLGPGLASIFQTVARRERGHLGGLDTRLEIPQPSVSDVGEDREQEARELGATTGEMPSTTLGLLRSRLADAMSSGDVEELRNIWPSLLREQPELLIEAFRLYGRQVRVRRIIASGLSESMLRDLVGLLEPAENRWIKDVMGRPDLLVQALGQSGMQTDGFRALLWEFTLSYLLLESGARFDKPSFVKSLVQQIATYSHAEYHALIRSLAASPEVFRASNNAPRELPGIAGSLVAMEDSSRSLPEASASESRELIRSYELYDGLRQSLLGGSSNKGEESSEVILLVDQLTRTYPSLLTRLYRELQAGEISAAGIAVALSVDELSHLVLALLSVGQQAESAGPSDLMVAVDRYSEQARDVKGYYLQVLECVVQNQNIDFEAILESGRSVTEAVGQEPDTGEEQATPDGLPVSNMAPPKVVEDTGTLPSYSREGATADSGSDSRELIRSYELYEGLRRRLLGGSSNKGEESGEVIQLVDQLTRTYPSLLTRLYRELQAGEISAGGIAAALSVDELAHLVQALLSVGQQAESGGPSDLMVAVARYSEQAEDIKGYYTRILGCLVENQNIDFEAKLESDRSVSEAPGLHSDTVEEQTTSGDLSASSMSPPMGSDDTGTLPSYSREGGTADSGSDSRELIWSYELYEGLRQRLLGGSSNKGEEFSDVILLLDQLTRAYPSLLTRLYRELQAGEISAGSIAAALSVDELAHLVQALLSVSQQAESGGPSDLMVAVARFAEQAEDVKGYYTRVLLCLVENQNIDFEAIIALDETAIEAVGHRQNRVEEQAPPDGLPADQMSSPMGGEGTEALLGHLRVGGALSVGDSAQLIWTLELLLVQQPGRLRQLLQPVLEDSDAVRRIIVLLPERLLTRVLYLLRPSEHPSAQRSADIIADACLGLVLSLETAIIHQAKWRYIFRHLLEEGLPYEEGSFVRGFADHLAAETGQADPGEFRTRLSQQITSDTLIITRERHESIVRALIGESGSGANDRAGLEPTSPRVGSVDVEPDITEGIYIANSGQVLAAPYLSRLFAMLDLTEAGSFKDRVAAERSVHLLQFMVNESTDSPEYQLVLNKILCGVRVGLPIDREIEITDREKEVIEGLIQGMIQNWKAIGNTSVIGFRESFLQRGGRLWIENDAWHLQVEPRAFDMLLDSIPWSFSTIKFPWMERVIYVEWR